MKCCATSSVALVLVVCGGLLAQEKTPPGILKLEQFEPWIGTWVNEQGETSSFEWICNKSYIMYTAGDFREIIGWDLKEKAITSWGYGTHGGQGKLKWTKIDDGWKAEADWLDRWGENADVWRTITFDGETMKVVWSYNGQKTSDEAKPQGSIPAEARKALSFFVGTWQSEIFENGTKIGQETDTRSWLPGKYAVLMKTSGQENKTNIKASGISGWDANGEQLIERWYSSDGLSATVRYPLRDMKDNVWSGSLTVTFADGKSYDGKCSLDVNDGGWTWIARWKQDGEKMERKSVTRKLQQAPVKKN